MNTRHQKIIGLGLVVLALGLAVLLQVAPDTQAQGLAPPTATPNTPPPVNYGNGNNNDNNSDDGHSLSPGAYIELQIKNAPAGTWSVVQWQDGNGDWQNVEGW